MSDNPAPGRPQTVEHELAQASSSTDRRQLPWGTPGSYAALPCWDGRLKGEHSTLGVRDDLEAVAVWIAERASRSTHTAVSYRREAERLLLWAAETRAKPLSDLTREDFLAFRQFLADPRPPDRWIMGKRVNREHPGWRPFLGPLSGHSQMQTQRILYGMMRYLTETGWLMANPMPAPRAQPTQRFQPKKRSLSPQLWACVWERILNEDRSSSTALLKAERTRWIFGVLYDLGLRANELCSHSMGDFRQNHRQHWSLALTRKGGKQVELPVPERTMRRLKRFRRALDMPPYPTPGEGVPLVPSFTNLNRQGVPENGRFAAISTNQLYREVTRIFRKTADWIAGDDPYGAETLRRASPHWLRHTALTALADSSGDLRLVQALGSHGDINTSAQYTKQDEEALRRALESQEGPWE